MTLGAGTLPLTSGQGTADPTAPITIDVGRQLLIDNHLIAETNLRRVFHKPRVHERTLPR